jgi:hypothetical protein
MSYRLAYDTDPGNPNPHPLELDDERYETEEAAYDAGRAEDDEQRREGYSDDDLYSWIVVRDKP